MTETKTPMTPVEMRDKLVAAHPDILSQPDHLSTEYLRSTPTAVLAEMPDAWITIEVGRGSAPLTAFWQGPGVPEGAKAVLRTFHEELKNVCRPPEPPPCMDTDTVVQDLSQWWVVVREKSAEFEEEYVESAWPSKTTAIVRRDYIYCLHGISKGWTYRPLVEAMPGRPPEPPLRVMDAETIVHELRHALVVLPPGIRRGNMDRVNRALDRIAAVADAVATEI